MADKEEKKDEEGAEADAPKKPSFIMTALAFLLVTAIAAGAGFGATLFLKPSQTSAMAKPDPGMDMKDESKDGKKADGEKDNEEAEMASSGYALALEPILTNLAAPENVWVRMEVSIVAQGDADEALAAQIHQDLFTYMRTVKLHHVDGPSGFLNLKAELKERAAIRSEGSVKDVLIRTLLFE